jgi:hypothetical protein
LALEACHLLAVDAAWVLRVALCCHKATAVIHLFKARASHSLQLEEAAAHVVEIAAMWKQMRVAPAAAAAALPTFTLILSGLAALGLLGRALQVELPRSKMAIPA